MKVLKFLLNILLYIALTLQLSRSINLIPPNIIFILADDLGYGDLSLNGNPLTQTLKIDYLAQHGTYLTNYYSPASVCTPARGSILTGRYFRRLGLYPGVLNPYSIGGLNQTYDSYASKLTKNGYSTAMIGKWHLGLYNGHHPLNHGFNYYYGIPMSHNQCLSQLNGTGAGTKSNRVGPCPILENHQILEQGYLNMTRVDEQYLNQIKKLIQLEPYYIHIGTHHVHIPDYPNDNYVESLQALDKFVGEITTLTKDQNTIIILTSDNGATYAYGDHGGLNYPFRCSKGSTWEGGHRVPAIIYSTRGLIPQKRSKLFATGLDWYSTILAMANVSNQDWHDGFNLYPSLRNGLDEGPRREFFFHSIRSSGRIEAPGAVMAIRKDNYKYHLYTAGGNCLPTYYDHSCRMNNILKLNPQLYDLEKDPSEKNNLILQVEYLNVSKNLQKNLMDHIKTFQDAPSEILKPQNLTAFPCANFPCHTYPYCCHT